MNDYFHAHWYVDTDGLLQRRTSEYQQRVGALLSERGTLEELSADAARWMPADQAQAD